MMKMTGKTKSDLNKSITEAFTDQTTSTLLPMTVVILPPKLTGKRTWEATVHLSDRPARPSRLAS